MSSIRQFVLICSCGIPSRPISSKPDTTSTWSSEILGLKGVPTTMIYNHMPNREAGREKPAAVL